MILRVRHRREQLGRVEGDDRPTGRSQGRRRVGSRRPGAHGRQDITRRMPARAACATGAACERIAPEDDGGCGAQVHDPLAEDQADARLAIGSDVGDQTCHARFPSPFPADQQVVSCQTIVCVVSRRGAARSAPGRHAPGRSSTPGAALPVSQQHQLRVSQGHLATQLEQALRDEILSGELQPGTRSAGRGDRRPLRGQPDAHPRGAPAAH